MLESRHLQEAIMGRTVTMFGEMWAMNLQNKNRVPRSKQEGGNGVYVLYDGSMPVYVGKGNLHSRIAKARVSKIRGQLWDHFSWYSLNPGVTHDIEALVLRMLPSYLRSLTKQKGKFQEAKPIKEHKEDRTPEYITRKAKRES
jgi:hypothetical protein